MISNLERLYKTSIGRSSHIDIVMYITQQRNTSHGLLFHRKKEHDFVDGAVLRILYSYW